MPSWQSYMLGLLLRLRVKYPLGKAKTAAQARHLMGRPLPVPPGATFKPGRIGGIEGEWAEAAAEPVGSLLYLHGGGYFACSSRTHRPLTSAYALRGFKVFAPDYRLAPENPFPAAVDDALAAYRGLLDQEIPPASLAIGGDSAGAGLALAMLLAAKAAGLPMPACALLFSPWTDLAITGATAKTNRQRDSLLQGQLLGEGAELYLNGADPKNPLASPLYGDLAGLPPLLIQVGNGEVLRDDSTRFASRAVAAGVTVDMSIWDNMPHGWQLYQQFLPEARAALGQAVTFAKAHLALSRRAA